MKRLHDKVTLSILQPVEVHHTVGGFVETMHSQRYAAGFFGGSGSVSTVGDRVRYIAQAQLPFLAILGVVSLGLALADPALVGAKSYLFTSLFAVILSGVALLLPWERLPRTWVWAIALGDFVVVALLSAHLSEVFPAIVVLIVFPVMWMAYEFGVRAAPLSLVGASLAVLVPHFVAGVWTMSSLEVAGITVRAAFIVLFAVSVGIMSDLLRGSREMVGEVSAELRASLAAAEDRELTLRAIIDTVDAAIVVFDTNGAVITTNETARSHYRKSSSSGENTDAEYNEHTRLREGLIFRRDRRTPVPRSDGIIARALRDEPLAGRVYWLGEGDEQIAVTSAARRVVRSDGEVLGTVIVAHDVTALVEAVSVRDDFLSTVSHELRTPLTNIIGYLEVIEDAAPQVGSELAIVQKNAYRLLTLVTELLSAGGTTAPVHRIPVDVADVVQRKVALMQPAAAAAGVALGERPSTSITAEVDPNALRTMVEHLLTNALKFTRSGGEVTVTVHSDDTSVWIVVDDTGIGIATEHQRQVFDRFFRAPTAKVGAVPGTGLGLSIVKALVDAHGGAITLQSELGRGTTVRVELPLRADRSS
jgi:two-component system phosphate regulon sensor histidine kinase PhoR